MDKDINEERFDNLVSMHQKIESELGELSWERLDSKRACRIAKYIELTNDQDMIDWGIETLVKFRTTFQPYVKEL